MESTLYAAGVRIFGSWRSVLMAAGITPELGQAHEKWSLPKVLGIIRMLAQRRRRLRPEEIQRRYGNVDEAARRYFGSWPKAILAAGVDPAKILRVVPWSKERIIEAILTRVLHNKPLGVRSVSPPSLAEAAVRIFGSWDSALMAAGLDPQAYVDAEPEAQAPSRRGRPRKAETGMPAKNSQERGDPATVSVMRVRKPPTPWSNQTVLEAIVARHLAQRRMDSSSVQEEERSLYRAATWRHGTWRSALLAAGLNPNAFPKSQKVSPAH